jgi:ectoine hydroxylase-related dioxygenase (phytanoyl-CoA dioxygenase family)
MSDTQRASFADEGWCVVDDLFLPDECDAIVAAAAHGFEMPVGDPGEGPLEYKPMLHLAVDELVRWASDPRWADLVLALVGGDARLYWEQLVTKPPQSRTVVPWHQDNGYSPVIPEQYLTCWLALEDATLDNGCMWVIPGSHRWGTVEHVNTGGFFQVGYDGPDDGVAVPLRKGSALLFSSLSQHRSGINVTDGHRRAWIVQFCPADAVHGRTHKPFDDRLLVARDGEWLSPAVRERPFDVRALLG